MRSVFNTGRKRRLDALIAQLSVLYEDLRLEIHAILQDSIPILDVLDSEDDHADHLERVGAYRRHYFLRRSIGTLYEFAVALRHLNTESDFKLISNARGFDQAMWEQAIEFFSKNEKVIRKLRNDVGGHFGEKPARYAIENLDGEAVGKIELIRGDENNTEDPRLHFVKEIVAKAIFRNLPGYADEHFEDLVKRCDEGYQHASNCVQLLVALYLWPRFGLSG